MMDHMVMLSRIVALRRFSLLRLLKLGIVPMAIDMSMNMLHVDTLHFLLAQQIYRSRSPLQRQQSQQKNHEPFVHRGRF